MACALEVGGERAHVEQVVVIGVDHLVAVSGRDFFLISVRGALLLIVVMVVSVQDDPVALGWHFVDVWSFVERFGDDCNHVWIGFGLINVRTYALVVVVRFDQLDCAVEIVSQINIDSFVLGFVGCCC